jgi:hypothetical protein
MHLTKIGILALSCVIVFTYCEKDRGYTIKRYKNSYLYGDSVNTWYPFQIVKSHKKTVPTDTTPVYKTVAVFVNNTPDTSNFKITFSKQRDYDFLVDYEMPDSMAHLLRVPNKGEANLDEGNGSITLEQKYMAHQTGDMFSNKTYKIYNKDSVIETEEVQMSFR